MATTGAGARLTRQHHAAQLAIRARSVQGLLRLWRGVDPANLRSTIDTFIAAAVLLTERGYEQSAQQAVRYFESFRRTEGAAGPLTIEPARLPQSDVIAEDLRGAALAGILAGRRSGMSVGAAKNNGLIRVTGALIKQVLAGGRMTIISGTDADREALGWARVTTGDPCAFCRALASRGQVYKTEKSADFQPHEGCGCVPEPVYAGPQLAGSPVRQAEAYRKEYRTAQEWARESGTLSAGTSNDALNNLRRWLANGRPEPGRQVTGVPGE